MKKIILILFVNIFLFANSYVNLRDFSLYRSDNIRGDVVMVGNSVLQTPSGVCASLTTQNNRIYAVYADKDNDPNTYNSTWAKLKLPAGVDSSKIVYALLYWQGRVGYSSNLFKYGPKIKLKLYGNSNYTDITSIPEKFNNRYGDYQGVADVTDLLKQSIDNVDQSIISTTGYQEPIWVANLYTAANGRNLYGAWSLIVVYKDDNAHLKNITLFDGYDEIYNESKSFNLTGFLTPQRGVVNAKFMVFSGEGDVVYRDSISLTNNQNQPIPLGTDFFHSSEDIDGVNITDRDPSCQNTIGIDLRTISIGSNAAIPIIGNNQNSTTVTLSSNGDQYFPGVFIFSTDLYEPRVCYYIDTITDEDNNIVYENKHFVKDVDLHKKYKVSFWIANMKKSPDDEDIEVAKKVQVFVDTEDFNYTTSSTYIKNLGDTNFNHKTDANDTDIYTFTMPNNHRYKLGIGANGFEGGTIDVANNFSDTSKIAFIDLNGSFTLTDANEINLDNIFHFKAAFATTSVTIAPSEALPIPKCIDFNSQGSVFAPANGKFNVVNENFPASSNIDPLSVTDPKNALYTQIANKSFNIQILSLDNDYTTLTNFNGDVEVDLIPTPNFAPTDTDTIKESKCELAPTLQSVDVSFNNEDRKTISFIYPKVNQNVTFRITSFDYTGCNYETGFQARIRCMFRHYQDTVSECANECIYITSNTGARNCMRCMLKNRNIPKATTCARNNFAIRPDHFIISANGINRADNNISFVTIKSVDFTGNIATDYNVSSNDLNLSAIDLNPSCSSEDVDYDFEFKNGIAYINYIKYPEVGNIQLKLSEKLSKEYAIVDQNDTTQSQRLISISSSNPFRVLPDHFAIYNINSYNFNTASFTYLSNDLNMSAIFSATIEAQNANNQITHNYSQNCYAKNIDINISHIASTPIIGINNVLTQYSSTPKNLPISFQLNDQNFTNGQANLNLNINFDRKPSVVVNPFNFTLQNINIVDQNGTIGATALSNSFYFVYGKIAPKDTVTIKNQADLYIPFVIYNGNKWVTNIAHNNKIYGDVNNTYSTSNISVSLNENAIIHGEQNITMIPNTTNRPYKVKLHLNIPTWLWYSPYNKTYMAPNNNNTNCLTHPCVNVLFLKSSTKTWGGTGTNRSENDVNTNTVNSEIKQNNIKNDIYNRINW